MAPEFLIFADESGDHGGMSQDPASPRFTMAFCLVRREDYVREVAPAIQALKLEVWGHEGIRLNDRNIRKGIGPFYHVSRRHNPRKALLRERLDALMDLPVRVVAAVVDKPGLIARVVAEGGGPVRNLYEVCLPLCLAELHALIDGGHGGRTTPCLFRMRGRREDITLIRETNIAGNIIEDGGGPDWMTRIEPHMSPRWVSAPGLELADQVARAVSLHAARPRARNAAWRKLKSKALVLRVS